MKEEYKKDFKQISAILPNAEADAVKLLLREKGLTQPDFIRGAYYLLLNGDFSRIPEIAEKLNK
ncbi:MAG: hypothetical protein ACI4VW_06740 [Acutalibacteraceae bacterium]